MTQVNTPYPATPYLAQFLKGEGHCVNQLDLGIDLFHRVFSPAGLDKIKSKITLRKKKSDLENFFLDAFNDYQATITPVINFLKGNNPTLALRIARRTLLPEGPRFNHLDQHEKEISGLFGEMGVQDKAKYIASLYLDDLADIIKYSIDERFEFSRYGESLASSQASFEKLYQAIFDDSLIDNLLYESFLNWINKFQPEVVGLSFPFPGNVLAGLKLANFLKKNFPHIKIIAGGGFVNTELRELSDLRFFEFVDYLTFDDGEIPLKNILQFLEGKSAKEDFVRTWYLENGAIVKSSNTSSNINFKILQGPSYEGLNLSDYIPMLELPNPMHRMWSDFRWNKMLLAHGCYWKKCTFCDVSLDYIERFEPTSIDNLICNIKRIIEETKCTGFHFVDEAAPPALVKKFCERVIEEDLKITWWTNLRFDQSFEKIAELMSDAGCVAVTGGLEVGSPRILKMINKGVTIEQVSKVTKAFSEHGIYVHAYLMYGFPTQTILETIDSLEVVRQLFLNDCIHSAYWHRFMCTAHSPVGKNPSLYNIKLIPISVPKEGLFAKNTVDFIDESMPDLDMLGKGLNKALYNFMHGVGLSEDVRAWFDESVPKTKVHSKFIFNSLKA